MLKLIDTLTVDLLTCPHAVFLEREAQDRSSLCFRRQSERRRELEPTTGTGNEKRRTLRKSTVTVTDNLTKKNEFVDCFIVHSF